MAYISSAVEYGLHALLYLSERRADGKGSSIRALALFQGIPRDYLAKIFTKLHKSGLVIATEGVTGGFILAKPVEEISVLEVIMAIDGDKPFFECKNIRERCVLFQQASPPQWAVEGVCSIHAVMMEAEKKMKQELSQHTLADISKKFISKAPKGFLSQMEQWFTSF